MSKILPFFLRTGLVYHKPSTLKFKIVEFFYCFVRFFISFHFDKGEAFALTGIPVSTTHSLTGALLGAGIIAVGTNINLHILGGKFFAPLLFSPAMAVLLTLLIYPSFKRVRMSLGIERQMCLCVGGNS